VAPGTWHLAPGMVIRLHSYAIPNLAPRKAMCFHGHVRTRDDASTLYTGATSTLGGLVVGGPLCFLGVRKSPKLPRSADSLLRLDARLCLLACLLSFRLRSVAKRIGVRHVLAPLRPATSTETQTQTRTQTKAETCAARLCATYVSLAADLHRLIAHCSAFPTAASHPQAVVQTGRPAVSSSLLLIFAASQRSCY
jgi:hypothetical protein